MGKIMHFVQGFKDDIHMKRELEKTREAILKRLRGGRKFFADQSIKAEYGVNTIAQTNLLLKASGDFAECVNALLEVESKIKDIDICIELKLETFLTDFVVKFDLPSRPDQTGDKMPKETMVLVPFYSDNPQFTEIVPEDLKVILFLKDKFKVRNFSAIKPINKLEYYKEEIEK
jgi:hypothetical protein